MPAKKTPASSTAGAVRRRKSAAAPAKPRQSAGVGPQASRSREEGDGVATIDRRRKPRRSDLLSEEAAAPAPATPLERRAKTPRRRQIDPTTCERDYSVEEVEFMNALDEYKRKSGRMFPTCSEVLEVIRDLGYVKLSPSEKTLFAAARGEHEATDLGAPGESANE